MLFILCFGNPYLDEDNLALHIADALVKDILKHEIKNIEVIKCISPDEILNYTDKHFMILDVVKGIDDVMLIEDIDRLKSRGIITMHDFDLGFFLKLMKETGKIEKVSIIGIPQKADPKTTKEKVLNIIKNHRSQTGGMK